MLFEDLHRCARFDDRNAPTSQDSQLAEHSRISRKTSSRDPRKQRTTQVRKILCIFRSFEVNLAARIRVQLHVPVRVGDQSFCKHIGTDLCTERFETLWRYRIQRMKIDDMK